MVQKSGVHQLRFGSFIPLFTRFYTSQVVVWDFFHQQYDQWQKKPNALGLLSNCKTFHDLGYATILRCERKKVNQKTFSQMVVIFFIPWGPNL